ncbi:LssY C-terminal domain-containing protein [Aliivibrio fischeri]|uniref:LssY C-terminal domain-containing protein n=1 Tax=Aliivibrio fischeri TaxID=668 RepID=UPI0012DA2CE1|nr:LssY C-terminal domain-containing protein [Aliivibrio fischeri]MUJ38190.1 hypothetical protein [Aliivibrio fischeri]
MFDTMTLFWGALFDALIGPNVFIPGEPFLIAAGFQLHQGIWSGVVAVILGGFLGDQLSYVIGRRFGRNAQSWLMRWQPKTRRPVARCRLLLQKKGTIVLVFSRLLGPVAWIVPFIAGVNHIGWGRFTLLTSIGLLLGVTQFVLWGYLLSYGIDTLPLLKEAELFVIEHIQSILMLIFLSVFLFIAKRYRWRRLGLKFTFALIGAVAYLNYSHFFWTADDLVKDVKAKPLYFDETRTVFKAFPGESSFFDAQAINVVFIGNNPQTIMNQLGWIENKTFSRNDINLVDYFLLMRNKTPPVSDLFWNGRVQDMAFQLPGNLLKRSHIRWWNAGRNSGEQQVWLGALSYDDGLTFTPYRGIVTMLHSIDSDVDKERDKFKRTIDLFSNNLSTSKQAYSAPVSKDEEHDYYSDGEILVIKTRTLPIGNNG